MEIKKFESFKFFCNAYIKNNSYINLDNENHIRIVWSCSNAVKTHNVSSDNFTMIEIELKLYNKVNFQ